MALLQTQFECNWNRGSGQWLSLVLFLLFLIPVPGWAGISVCSDLFSDTSYFMQVVQSRGLRFFIKTSEVRPETKWHGVLRHVPQAELESSFKLSNGLRYAIKTLPLKLIPGIETVAPQGGRYELTPAKAVYDQTVLRASNTLSQKFFNKNLEPAFF
jgi:hypothetical protein